MELTEIIKKQSFFKTIVEEKENGLLTNSILFFCDDDVTSRVTLVMTALLLEYPTFDLLNENCAEFQRIEGGADLDVKVFPKNNEKLLVSDSEEIVTEAYVKPVNLPYKVFLLNNFDISTPEAQNKLLKILEEPPKNVFFLLSAKSEEKVLPTIKSRCKKVKIGPLAENEIEKLSTNKLANILGRGYVGKTKLLNQKENLKEVADFAVSVICELKNSKQVLKFSKRFLELKDEIELILEIISLCLEDLLKIKCESEKLRKMTPYSHEIDEVEAEYSVLAITEINKLISHFRQKLEYNANLVVAIDNFLLKMLEVKYLCK